jgi:hypothetical protein
VGHSKGAIELAHRAFVKKDSQIKALISIAGRLRVVESQDKPCSTDLIPTVNDVYQGIQSMPGFPLYQIFGTRDWMVPREAMAVNNYQKYIREVPGAMHLNILYHKTTVLSFKRFLDDCYSVATSSISGS